MTITATDWRTSRTSPQEFAHAREVAITAAEAAGRLLRERACAGFEVHSKGGAGDLVTDLDLASERLIIEHLQAAFPDHQIVSEEAGVVDPNNDDTSVWLVDPLDGTNNLAIGLPAYVVGVSLCRNRMPVVGVVHDPIARQTWSAALGAGATGPGGPLVPPPLRPTPHGPVLAWTQGHGIGRDDGFARSLKLVLDSTARRVLQLWAPLLSWVMLARGDLDGIVGYQAEGIDLPAGLLIAAEAGMTVLNFDGEPFDARIGLPQKERCFVAGHPDQVERLLALVTAADRVEPTVNELLVSRSIPAW
jgi:myo-inositol-1(or 4)-monophosphatase